MTSIACPHCGKKLKTKKATGTIQCPGCKQRFRIESEGATRCIDGQKSSEAPHSRQSKDLYEIWESVAQSHPGLDPGESIKNRAEETGAAIDVPNVSESTIRLPGPEGGPDPATPAESRSPRFGSRPQTGWRLAGPMGQLPTPSPGAQALRMPVSGS